MLCAHVAKTGRAWYLVKTVRSHQTVATLAPTQTTMKLVMVPLKHSPASPHDPSIDTLNGRSREAM
jgi:hypothetical protein